jgi:hypothetical protein
MTCCDLLRFWVRAAAGSSLKTDGLKITARFRKNAGGLDDGRRERWEEE